LEAQDQQALLLLLFVAVAVAAVAAAVADAAASKDESRPHDDANRVGANRKRILMVLGRNGHVNHNTIVGMMRLLEGCGI